MVVHPAPGNWTGTLVNALVGRGQGLAPGGGDERPGLVHRIDKDTSGLLVVAKSERAHRLLSAAVAARQVTRRYAAACWGHLANDQVTVERAIGRDPRDRKRMAALPPGAGGGKPARTDFVRLGRYDAGDLLRAHLHTGRTHQIRVHLASIGHPVLGDDTYGGGGGRRLVALPSPRHFLHAALLRFRHPATGRRGRVPVLAPGRPAAVAVGARRRPGARRRRGRARTPWLLRRRLTTTASATRRSATTSSATTRRRPGRSSAGSARDRSPSPPPSSTPWSGPGRSRRSPGRSPGSWA
jgi:hypothetical protein